MTYSYCIPTLPHRTDKTNSSSGATEMLAARWLRHLLQSGTPKERRSAYLKLRSSPRRWSEITSPTSNGCDALARVHWTSRAVVVEKPLAVVTIGSAGYGSQINDLLTTWQQSSGVSCNPREGWSQGRFVVVVVGDAPDVLRVAARHRALVVHCVPEVRLEASVKAALYSATDRIIARRGIYLDSDVFVVGGMNGMVHQMESHTERIHAAMSARTTADDEPRNWEYVVKRYYGGDKSDADYLAPHGAPNFLRLNSGVFGGSAYSMLRLRHELDLLRPMASAFIDSGAHAADELIFSLAVSRAGSVRQVSKNYNLQMYAEDAVLDRDRSGYHWWHDGEVVSVMHFASTQGQAKVAAYRQQIGGLD